jgi:hypothetical protein
MAGRPVAKLAQKTTLRPDIKVATDFREGIIMKLAHTCLVPALAAASAVFGVVVAPPATADCTSSGYATVCAEGDVRGANAPAASSGSYYPYPCSDDWLCDDGVDVTFGPIWDRPGRPGIGGPGRPGGIGPR